MKVPCLPVRAGAPPDYFDPNGQNWGFPTYNWEAMAVDNYAWFHRRLHHMEQVRQARGGYALEKCSQTLPMSLTTFLVIVKPVPICVKYDAGSVKCSQRGSKQSASHGSYEAPRSSRCRMHLLISVSSGKVRSV